MKLLVALALVALAGVQDSTVYTAGNGVSLPQVVKQVKAEYTNEAKQNAAKFEHMLHSGSVTE